MLDDGGLLVARWTAGRRTQLQCGNVVEKSQRHDKVSEFGSVWADEVHKLHRVAENVLMTVAASDEQDEMHE